MLVVGATGRVGRILVRKLLLRGYKVRAFVRQSDGAGEEQQAQRPAGKLLGGTADAQGWEHADIMLVACLRGPAAAGRQHNDCRLWHL